MAFGNKKWGLMMICRSNTNNKKHEEKDIIKRINAQELLIFGFIGWDRHNIISNNQISLSSINSQKMIPIIPWGL
jgi:hypothetical protein